MEQDYTLILSDPAGRPLRDGAPPVAAAGRLLRDALLTGELLGIDSAEVAELVAEAERGEDGPVYLDDVAAEIATFLEELLSRLGRRAPPRRAFRRCRRGGLIFDSGGRRLELGRERFEELASLFRAAAERGLWVRGGEPEPGA